MNFSLLVYHDVGHAGQLHVAHVRVYELVYFGVVLSNVYAYRAGLDSMFAQVALHLVQCGLAAESGVDYRAVSLPFGQPRADLAIHYVITNHRVAALALHASLTVVTLKNVVELFGGLRVREGADLPQSSRRPFGWSKCALSLSSIFVCHL